MLILQYSKVVTVKNPSPSRQNHIIIIMSRLPSTRPLPGGSLWLSTKLSLKNKKKFSYFSSSYHHHHPSFRSRQGERCDSSSSASSPPSSSLPSPSPSPDGFGLFCHFFPPFWWVIGWVVVCFLLDLLLKNGRLDSLCCLGSGMDRARGILLIFVMC